ncbi:hypothetical protein NL108_018405 [Boleophthalmus pectinirostris]|nr:hypothetical protein NL108_018405 [Boleophthalmus pectinirostris]
MPDTSLIFIKIHLSVLALTFEYHDRYIFINFFPDSLLPLCLPVCCSSGTITITTGKPVILVGMNGRYNLHLPNWMCSCGRTQTVDLKTLIDGGYCPATVNSDTVFEVDLLATFGELKVTAPALSCLAFVGLLDQRTLSFGRSGKVSGEALQRAFLQWSYAQYIIDTFLDVPLFKCPACTPSMLAVAVDGNRKLYRFQNQPVCVKSGFYDGVFLAKDEEVASFVQHVHGTTRHNLAKGRCGSSQCTAAKETARKSSSKIDEEGVEVAVCRHGFLLRGLNMYRGEIFAYPLYLQKELSHFNVKFFCMDIICKYWPYLQRVAQQCPEMGELMDMPPFCL